MWRWGLVGGALLLWLACDPPVVVEDTWDTVSDSDLVESDGLDTDSVDTDGLDTDGGDTDTAEWPAGPEFTAAFTRFGGCGDVWLYAANAEDTVLLLFRSPYMASYAHSTLVPQVLSVAFGTQSLPDGTTLEVRQGTHLTDVVCDDAVEHSSEVIRTWLPVTGDLRVMVTATGTPDAISFPAEAVFSWEDARLAPSDDLTGAIVDAGNVSFEADVGWFAG